MLLRLNPTWTEKEISAVIRTIINHKTSKLKSSHIINFIIPEIGRVKSHGLKKVKRYRKYLIKDRRKKKIKYNKSLLTKEKLLF